MMTLNQNQLLEYHGRYIVIGNTCEIFGVDRVSLREPILHLDN